MSKYFAKTKERVIILLLAQIYGYILYCTEGIGDDNILMKDLVENQSGELIFKTLIRMNILKWNEEIVLKMINNFEKSSKLVYRELEKLTGNIPCVDNCSISITYDEMILQKIMNHPPHVIDEDGNISPSAFIPFCWMGKDSHIGVKIDQFQIPVCNNFKPKIRKDQICYEIDPNEFINDTNRKEFLSHGLTLIIDENQDRHIDVFEMKNENMQEEGAMVYLDTPGGTDIAIFSKILDLFYKILLS